MNRIGFWQVAGGLCLALTGCVGCGGDPCGDARSQIAETCGEDFDTSDFESACGNMFVDGDACKSCIETALADGEAACTTLMTTCRTECYCPAGVICPPVGDAGDAGMEDADVDPPAMCGTTGGMAGQCRMGTACATGLQCAAEWGPNIPTTTMPSTLGSVFRFNAGTLDPEHDNEYLSTGEPSDIPLYFAPGDPGGQCTRGCNFATQAMPDDGCGSCATCSNELGGSDAFASIGIGARSIAVVAPDFNGIVGDTQDGMCRLNCAFDAETNGGCPSGYTCDPGTNVCTEACVSTAQCNAVFGLSRAEAYVVGQLEGSPYTCNTTTGRCDYEPPASAGLNTECETNLDCPEFGICLIGGRCGTLACSDATGTMAGDGFDCMAAEGECLGFGGNNGSVCVQGCMTPDDCFPGQACSPFTMATPSGATGFCFGVCDADSECRGTERCREIRADDPDAEGDSSLSVCEAICDPDPAADPVVADAITCGESEICEQLEGQDYGFCVALDQLCGSDDDCNGDQACEIEGKDQLGRCVDGCRTDDDCAAGAFCRRQPATNDDDSDECDDDDDCTTEGEGCHVDGYCAPLNEVGVCRVPGEPCGLSAITAAGVSFQPLNGSEQCPPGQTCNAPAPTTAAPEATDGVCVGGDFPDGGMPTDGGIGSDAGADDAGTGSDAGTDGGGFITLPDGNVIPLDAGIPL